MIDTSQIDRAFGLALRLQVALYSHDVQMDALLFESGRVAVPVGPGLVAVTDGEHIWWPAPRPGRHGRPRWAVYRTPALAAVRLAAQRLPQEGDRCALPR
ncbi:hypothetical protein AB0395_25655 [Streptosporangium sp. NPDC051023]|uniref:hypothetical protein n=1 Tax=Streptosporangium sp. NPDC051023 TaxID=3155410 RepID=UPI00344B31AF